VLLDCQNGHSRVGLAQAHIRARHDLHVSPSMPFHAKAPRHCRPALATKRPHASLRCHAASGGCQSFRRHAVSVAQQINRYLASAP